LGESHRIVRVRPLALPPRDAISLPMTMQQHDSPPDTWTPCAMASKDDEGAGTGLGVATRTRSRTKKPSLYKVLMLNDDYTPMEFVVLCLQRFFRMNIEDATRVMLHVHQKGVGVCGVFSHEVAETKATQVVDFARQHQHPLQCTIEKA
jgi:ATP-dependent Clp protease adaptor protein ClpS